MRIFDFRLADFIRICGIILNLSLIAPCFGQTKYSENWQETEFPFFSRSLIPYDNPQWGIGISFGNLSGWHEEGLQLKKITSEASEWLYGVGRGDYWFWQTGKGSLFEFNLASMEALIAYRYFLLRELPWFVQIGGGGIDFRGSSLASSRGVAGQTFTQKLAVKAFAWQAHLAAGFSWKLSRNFYMDWLWAQYTHTRIIYQKASSSLEEDQAVVFRKAIQSPRWLGFVNLSVGWLL